MNAQPSYQVITNPNPEESDLMVLFAGSSQTRNSHSIGPRVYDYGLIHHIISGKGRFICEGQTYSLSAGDCFVIMPETLVSYKADDTDPWAYRWVAFGGGQAARLLNRTGFTAQHPVLMKGKENGGALGHFTRIQHILREGGGAVNLKATGQLLMLLGDYLDRIFPLAEPDDPSVSRIEQQVRQAIHALTTQYSENLSIEALAAESGYNRAYFSKMFKQITGKAPVTFLLETRLHKAKLMLREKKRLTVEQVSFSVGFADPLYFSKQFKSMYGLSPSEYRRTLEEQL